MIQSGTKIRLLLVDDQAIMRKSLFYQLQGYPNLEVVMEASDGQEAVEIARKLNPDVILMDVSMPKLDGIGATEIIRSELPQIRVIGLSVYDDPGTVSAMLNAGAAAFLVKGSPSEALFDAICGSKQA